MTAEQTVFAGRRVVVEVPATIANLGAGFDCLGLAIDLSLRVELEVIAMTTTLTGRPDVGVEGEGAGEISGGRGNRFLEALEAGLRERRMARPAGTTWRVRMSHEIPLARGLGSSGAAAVAGLLAADALAGRTGVAADLDRVALLDRATTLEGHPDNVAPALLGGFVATLVPRSYRFDAPADLRIVLYIPDLHLSTARMRTVLPEAVPRLDAVANLGRVAVGVAGIASGDWSVLERLTEDRLHEPYRSVTYPQLPALEAAARSAGAIGACLAGGGSTVAAFTMGDGATSGIGEAMADAATSTDLPGRVRVVRARNEGAAILSAA